MVLWRYVVEGPDGARHENVVVAGNQEAARVRALRNAAAVGGRLVEGPTARGPR